MKKILLLGESWTIHMIHQKGFDSFTTTEYTRAGDEYRNAMEAEGWEVTQIPAHAIETDFPPTQEELHQYDLVVISDVGANTFLLGKGVFTHGKTEPNRLARIRDYVMDGGGLLMVGGYLSFSGIDAKAHYAHTPIAELLPVEVLETDDRTERPEGAEISVVAPEHPALGGVGTEWPPLLGFNRTEIRPTAELLATVDGYPLVAVTRTGAGRSGVFTSDLAPHWASPEFVEWQGYGQLWRALSSWIAG
ncbi:glutamine amidotransferase [Nesterenkonia muleiensis]|uniref:glutamine amidotransferase n=1 Tax=Nesterenkonia muleiensis TaxID=2282648 RepID=UPI000E7419A9|nr:glutamine amidotransferase [Nesterenkonia muleiensis]